MLPASCSDVDGDEGQAEFGDGEPVGVVEELGEPVEIEPPDGICEELGEGVGPGLAVGEKTAPGVGGGGRLLIRADVGELLRKEAGIVLGWMVAGEPDGDPGETEDPP